MMQFCVAGGEFFELPCFTVVFRGRFLDMPQTNGTQHRLSTAWCSLSAALSLSAGRRCVHPILGPYRLDLAGERAHNLLNSTE
jgi:hypothetical protein